MRTELFREDEQGDIHSTSLEVGDMIPDADALWCMLQAFRLTLTELDKSIEAGTQIFVALKSRTVVAVPTLNDYEQQFATLMRYRDQMREVVSRWGTMIEHFPPIEERDRALDKPTPPVRLGRTGEERTARVAERALVSDMC
jgi:hypothetical protein